MALPVLTIHGSLTRIPEISPDTEIISFYTSHIICKGQPKVGLICDAPEDSCYHGLPYSLLLYSVSNKTFLAVAHLECTYIDLSVTDAVEIPLNAGLRFKTCSFPYPPGSSHELIPSEQYRITQLQEGRDCPFFNGYVGEGGSRTTIHTVTFKAPGQFTLDVSYPETRKIYVTVTESKEATPSHWLADGKY